ncbi:MAG: hypothetical protein LIR50_21330 [Bacillota bacterium]|nr:hypothetical protein [Bacillota bacterium]
MTKKALHEALRKRYMTLVQDLMADKGEEVLVTGSNEIALPCVDDEGNDEFIVITFKIPTGSRDGDAYDGYAMAEDYQMKQDEKAKKAKVSAEAKAKKIAKDEKMRQQKAEAKAKREKGE